MRRRYLRQRLPWIQMDPSDLIAQGDPETVVFLPGTTLVGLSIKHLPDPFPAHLMLGVREDNDGNPISCLVTNELRIDYSPQSNQPRVEDEGDGA